MRVVGLLSGGKDSCYALMQCVAAGHEVVALATLLPPEGIEENDSHMYQSVGVRGVRTIAAAMGGLPLFTTTISGSAVNTTAHYSEALPEDEVEDLYRLLQDVKAGVPGGVEGVSVGAILSDYQRVRVEHICGRLGLVSLSYLWRRDQETLLEEMIRCGMEAVLVKVAGAGLVPSKHCGKTLKEMLPTLNALHSKFDLHVCGEGGEFESFTLDCPLFDKRIIIVEQELIEEPGDVGYLVLHKLELADKEDNTGAQRTLYERVIAAGVPTPDHYSRDVTEAVVKDPEDTSLDTCHHLDIDFYGCTGPKHNPATKETTSERGVTVSADGWWSAWGWRGNCVDTLLGELKAELLGAGVALSSAVEVRAFVKSLTRYASFNAAYKTHFGYNPPVRACLETKLQQECQIEVSGHHLPPAPRHVMHVQSVSHWAPANIGPYSQAVKVGPIVAVAGMIGLQAGTMTLVEGGARVEGQLALRHLGRVVEAVTGTERGHGCHMLMQVVCYCTSVSAYRAVRPVLRDLPCSVLPVVVAALPRNACVELHAWAHQQPGQGGEVTARASVLPRGHFVYHQQMQREDGTVAHCAVQGFTIHDEKAVTSEADVIDFINVVIDKVIGNWADTPSTLRIESSELKNSNETSFEAIRNSLLQHSTKSLDRVSSTDESMLNSLSISSTPNTEPSVTSDDSSSKVQTSNEDGGSAASSCGLLTVTVFYDSSIVPGPLIHTALTSVRSQFSAASVSLTVTAVPVTTLVADHFPLQTDTTAVLALTATRCPGVC